MKKNIRLVLLGELIVLIAVFLFDIFFCSAGVSDFAWFIDLPSLLQILFVLIPGLLVTGEWKDFVKAFSVGIRQYSLLELKSIIQAVDFAQKLTVYGAIFAIILSGVLVLGNLTEPEMLGPNVAICFLTGFYAVIIEYFLLPLRLNAEHKMNEEMDLGDD